MIKDNSKMIEQIRSGDVDGFNIAKYGTYQEGENVVLEGQDFKDLDLRDFALPFTVFKNCVLENVKIKGLPIAFKNSKARLDLRGMGAGIIAEGTDFTGTVFDENTRLGKTNPDSVGSVFSRCKFDKEFEEFLKSQNCTFTDEDVVVKHLGKE